MNHTQCLIIGSGPAGYTAAIYLVRSAIDCLLIEGLQVGGQLTQTTTIENFPGFPEPIAGPALMEAMRRQAERCGAAFLMDEVQSADLTGDVLAETGGQNAAEHQLVHVLGGDVGALQGFLDDVGAHVGGGSVLQRAAEGTDGGAAAIDYIQLFHYVSPSTVIFDEHTARA